MEARCGPRVSHRLVYAAGTGDWDTGAMHALQRFDGDLRVVLLSEDAEDVGAPAAQTERRSDATGVSVVFWTMAGATTGQSAGPSPPGDA